jgi:uncharacterized lipoprotein YbaY/heat shock protein HslJ
MVVDRRCPGWTLLTLASLLAHGIGSPNPAMAGSLEGSATLKVPLPVPAEAIFEAQLQEIGPANAPASLLGKARFKAGAGAPFAFRIPYVDGMLKAGHHYSVRALISEAGRLLFTTDTVQPVVPGALPAIQLELVPVGDAPLRGVLWLQAPAASVPVPAQAARQEVQLQLDPLTSTVIGSADCNRLQGTYRLEGERLSFSSMVSTMLQCESEVMGDERRFLADLQRVRAWSFADRKFQMLDGSGTVLLKFETRPQPMPSAGP